MFYFRELLIYKNNNIEHKQINIQSIFNTPNQIEIDICLKEENEIWIPISNILFKSIDKNEVLEKIDFSVFKNL